MRGADHIVVSGVDVGRRRRRADERLFVRFPVLAQGLGRVWSLLPRGSGARRRLLVRMIESGMAAGNRRDFDVLLAGFHPAIDYRVISAGPGGAVAPDVIGHHYGHAGYRYVWQAMLEGFDDLTLTPEHLYDLGDRVVSVTHMRGHGSGSGVPVDRLLFQVFFIRRGLVVKQEDYSELEEALAAARG